MRDFTFFGDVSREDMRRDLTKIDTKAASQVEFHGFQARFMEQKNRQ